MWVLLLEEFDYNVEYKLGRMHMKPTTYQKCQKILVLVLKMIG